MRVQVQPDMALASGGDEAVFDHPGGGVDQAQRMRVAAALVAGNIEDAEQFTVGRNNGRGRAGEKAVALQIVLAAMHDHRCLLGQGRADGIGAAPGLGPMGAWAQRHALGTAGHVTVTQGAQQHALGVGQDQQAGCAGHLLGHVVQHRLGVRHQRILPLHGTRQLSGRCMRRTQAPALRCQAGLGTALSAAR